MCKMWLFLLLLFFIPLSADQGTEACRKEVEKIDAQMQKLNVQKQKHIDLAIKYQKEGDDWQYSTGRIEDAHKSWNRANEERRKAFDLQMQIDLLIEKKQHIYQFYPEVWGS